MKFVFALVIFSVGFSIAIERESSSESKILNLQDRNFPYPNDGILQPENYYQRYRRTEYDPDEPFYQW